jgi:hypothetical protein
MKSCAREIRANPLIKTCHPGDEGEVEYVTAILVYPARIVISRAELKPSNAQVYRVDQNLSV